MLKSKFLILLDEMLELEPLTLKGPEVLEAIESWDSLAVVGLIAMVDENFGVTLSPQKIFQSKTVDDIVALLGDQITPD